MAELFRDSFQRVSITTCGTYLMRSFFNRLPFSLLIVLCLTLGLAPFVPEPHLWEKLKMLAAGELAKPIDMFDLLLHGTPWILLIVKLFFLLDAKREE
jgi:hypothetical protein